MPAKRQPLAVLPHGHDDRPPPDRCPARNAAGPSAAANLCPNAFISDKKSGLGSGAQWLPLH
jgi:hypothetical protein